MKKSLLILGALLSVGMPTFTQNVSENLQKKTAKEIINEAPSKALKQLKKEHLQEIIEEATNAVIETNEVIELLKKGQIEKASVLLDRIDSTLDRLIKAYGLVKIPVDVSFQIYTFNADLESARKLIEEVKKAINNNDLVKARAILNLLRDEIDIVTTYMPLDLYSQSLKLAKQLLKQNKTESAILALESALKTLEVATLVVPRPLLEAQTLLEDAKKIYKTQPQKALKLIEQIEKDLEKAKVLGYISNEKSIKPLLEQLSELKKAIKENLVTTQNQFQEASKTLNKVVNQNIKTYK
jgi:tetratricopeptide (TPR) repeat protein